MPSSLSSKQIPLQRIEQIAARARGVSELLSGLALLPEVDRLRYVETCASTAADIAHDLAEIAGGQNA